MEVSIKMIGYYFRNESSKCPSNKPNCDTNKSRNNSTRNLDYKLNNSYSGVGQDSYRNN